VRFSVRTRGTGLGGLSRALERTDALERAVRTGAEDVAQQAQDGLERDGGAGAQVLADTLEVTRARQPLSYRVATRAPLAWFREFGALMRAQRPWLRPALTRARGRIVRRIAQTLRGMVSRR